VKGSDWVKTLPAEWSTEREAAILQAVKDGLALPPKWVEINLGCDGNDCVIYVGEDVLCIGEADDYVRVNVCADTHQLICDHMGWIMPTTKVCDAIWRSAVVKVAPSFQPAESAQRQAGGYSPSMSDTEAMVRHSVDVAFKRGWKLGLLEVAGKQWVLSNILAGKTDRGANYGFYDPKAPSVSASGIRMWQTLGTRHTHWHSDYSQTARPVRNVVLLNGQEVPFMQVASDPDLCRLLSTEGPLKFSRLPAASPLDPSKRNWTPVVFEDWGVRLTFSRVLRRGDVSDDVGAWQDFLGASPDRKFGPITESLTRAWQRAHGLDDDGVVGPKTVAAANQVLTERNASGPGRPSDDTGEPVKPLVWDFVQARNYTKGPKPPRQIKWIVIHSAEMPEKPTAAEALAAWAAGPQAPKASWGYAVDSDSVVQCVRDEDIAWHAPGVNGKSIGIEHAGYARQSYLDWCDQFSHDMLLLSARLVATLCRRHGIPVQYVDAAGLAAGKPGITTHWQVTQAFKKSTHTDPGQGFPMDWYLAQVKRSTADGN